MFCFLDDHVLGCKEFTKKKKMSSSFATWPHPSSKPSTKICVKHFTEFKTFHQKKPNVFDYLIFSKSSLYTVSSYMRIFLIFIKVYIVYWAYSPYPPSSWCWEPNFPLVGFISLNNFAYVMSYIHKCFYVFIWHLGTTYCCFRGPKVGSHHPTWVSHNLL